MPKPKYRRNVYFSPRGRPVSGHERRASLVVTTDLAQAALMVRRILRAMVKAAADGDVVQVDFGWGAAEYVRHERDAPDDDEGVAIAVRPQSKHVPRSPT